MIALCVVLLLTALTGLFTVTARAIRRDVNERFDRIRARLEDEASALVHGLPHEHE